MKPEVTLHQTLTTGAQRVNDWGPVCSSVEKSQAVYRGAVHNETVSQLRGSR